MNTPKFTEGPYEIDRTERYYKPCVRKNGVIVAYLADNGAGCVNTNAFAEEDEANAQLIVAAPDLYDGCNALLGLIDLVSHNPDVPQFVKDILNSSHRKQEAEAAVAKARCIHTLARR